jgi:catechol 2,3-dioxygenase-like lactoylglutathione lyase family enzyme
MAAPNVFCEQFHPGLPVADITAAVDFYTNKLGFTLGFLWGDPTDFAGVNLGQVQVHLYQSTPIPNACSVYFVIDDADQLYEFQRANGVEVIEPPQDRPYEMRDYRIRDLYGNILAFGHYIQCAGPPVKIERVDVPVRLEKRLAALLNDLAEHKGMSVNSCLEETLLHTFEIVGKGVASPHTMTTLQYIQELKKKHGITYDTHASYRFTEE